MLKGTSCKQGDVSFAKKNRVLVVMGHLFEPNCPFSVLPKELVQIIATLTYIQFSVVKSIVRKGNSGAQRPEAMPINSLKSFHGTMATALCEELPDEIIAWEVRIFLFIFLFCFLLFSAILGKECKITLYFFTILN